MEFASSVRDFPAYVERPGLSGVAVGRPLEIVSWETTSNFQEPTPVRLVKMAWPQAGSWKLPVSAEIGVLAEPLRFPPHSRRRKAPPMKPEYIGKNHSRPGVGISNFQLPTLVLRASLEAGKL